MSKPSTGPTPEWVIATRFNDPSDYGIPDAMPEIEADAIESGPGRTWGDL